MIFGRKKFWLKKFLVEPPPPLCEKFCKNIHFFFLPLPSVCVPNFRPLVPSLLWKFRWGVLLLLVTGVKQSQLLVLSLSLKFDKMLVIYYMICWFLNRLIRIYQLSKFRYFSLIFKLLIFKPSDLWICWSGC